MDRENPPPKKPRNFDPRRSHKHIHQFRAIGVSRDGKATRILWMPVVEITDKSEEEIRAAIIRTFAVYGFARELVDRDRVMDAALADTIVETMTHMTSLLTVNNVVSIYFERIVEEAHGSDEVTIELEADWPPPFEDWIFKHGMETVKPTVDQVFSSATVRENLCLSIWENVFARVLFTIAEEKGCPLDSMPVEERDTCFDEYLRRDFGDNCSEVLFLSSQDWSRIVLDNLNPITWSNERLSRFVGFRVTSAHSEEDSGIHKIKLTEALRLVGLLASREPSGDLDLKLTDSRPMLLLPPEYKSIFHELLNGAVVQDFLRERGPNKEQLRKLVIGHARKLAGQQPKLTKKSLALALSVSRTTLDRYLREDPELWSKANEAFIDAKLRN